MDIDYDGRPMSRSGLCPECGKIMRWLADEEPECMACGWNAANQARSEAEQPGFVLLGFRQDGRDGMTENERRLETEIETQRNSYLAHRNDMQREIAAVRKSKMACLRTCSEQEEKIKLLTYERDELSSMEDLLFANLDEALGQIDRLKLEIKRQSKSCANTPRQRAQLVFFKHVTEMRATCDQCGKKKVMVALAEDNKWKCFECMQPNAQISGSSTASDSSGG